MIQNITSNDRLVLSGLNTRNRLAYQELAREFFQSQLSISNNGLGLKWDKMRELFSLESSWLFLSSIPAMRVLYAHDTNTISLGDFKAVNSVDDLEFTNRLSTLHLKILYGVLVISCLYMYITIMTILIGAVKEIMCCVWVQQKQYTCLFATYETHTITDWDIMLGLRIPYYTTCLSFCGTEGVVKQKYLNTFNCGFQQRQKSIDKTTMNIVLMVWI